MKISRAWATPVTIGGFVVMSVTGLLMFFHLDSGLNKVAHEWGSWVMVAGVALHAAANWAAFKQYFLSSGPGRLIIALGVVVLGASFVSLPGGSKQSPPMLAMKAVARAPLATIAPLTGRPAEQVVADLRKAGIRIADASASLESAVGGDRELQGRAMNVLFGKQGQSPPPQPSR